MSVLYGADSYTALWPLCWQPALHRSFCLVCPHHSGLFYSPPPGTRALPQGCLGWGPITWLIMDREQTH